jgi:hypothetical protein
VNISNEVKKIQADIAGINQRLCGIRAAAGGHNLLSTTHGDTTAAAAVRGDIITAQGVGALWTRLAKGNQYQFLRMGADEPQWDSVIQGGGLTAGRALFAGAAGVISDDSNFVWDNVNKRLGIAVANPAEKIEVSGNVKVSSQFISSLAVGTKPVDVTSTTLCSNFNADFVDGLHAAEIGAGAVTAESYFASQSYLKRCIALMHYYGSAPQGIGCGASATQANSTYSYILDGTTSWLQYSVAVNAGYNYIIPTQTNFKVSGDCDYVWTFQMKSGAATTNMILLFGLVDAGFAPITSDPAGRIYAFFVFAPAVSANWYYVVDDNVLRNPVDSGLAYAASTVYYLKMVSNSSVPNLTFSINGASSQTITANIPGITTGLFPFYIGIGALESAAKTYCFGGYQCYWDIS